MSGLLQGGQQGVADLVQVVGRDVGGHAHGDARGAVDQEVGETGGQHQGLFHGAVVVGHEVHGVLVQVLEEFVGQAGEAHLGVTHGRGGVAVDGPEVALAVHQRVAQGEVLGHAHHGVIDRGVAVGVVFTDDVADDAGALAVGPVIVVAALAHGEENAAVHRLEAVAHVRQGPADDDGQGVLQIRLADFILDVDGYGACFHIE